MDQNLSGKQIHPTIRCSKGSGQLLEFATGSVLAGHGFAPLSRGTQIQLNNPGIGSGTTPVATLRVIATRAEPGRCSWEERGCEADSCVNRGVSEACIGSEIHNEQTTKVLRKKIEQARPIRLNRSG